MKFNAYDAWTIPAPGTIVAGKYEVESECGRDGLAATVSAVHLGLGRRVVIRVLLPEWADDPQAIEQFRRDGRAAARAASDASPRIFDAGKLDDGAPYQVLDYLGEHEFAPIDRSSSPQRVPGVRGSDRVVASALLMLGALGTAAFMWLYSTVHENDGRRIGATLMQPATNVLDDGGADAGIEPPAAAMGAGGLTPGTIARYLATQRALDAGPLEQNGGSGRAAVSSLAPTPQATPSPSDARARGAGGDGQGEGSYVGGHPRTNVAPHRPQRTVVHVEPGPARASVAPPDSTSPYDSPSIGTVPEESSPRAMDAGATPGRSLNEANDNATYPEERPLDLRE